MIEGDRVVIDGDARRPAKLESSACNDEALGHCDRSASEVEARASDVLSRDVFNRRCRGDSHTRDCRSQYETLKLHTLNTAEYFKYREFLE